MRPTTPEPTVDSGIQPKMPPPPSAMRQISAAVEQEAAPSTVPALQTADDARLTEAQRLALPERCLRHPTPDVSRFPNKNGEEGKGSQRRTRDIFNWLYANQVGKDYDENVPICSTMLTSIFEIIRGALYSRGVEKGKYTYRGAVAAHFEVIQETRRRLERTYPELTYAQGYWAAIGFIKEVLRRDKTRSSFNRRSITTNTAEDVNRANQCPNDVSIHESGQQFDNSQNARVRPVRNDSRVPQSLPNFNFQRRIAHQIDRTTSTTNAGSNNFRNPGDQSGTRFDDVIPEGNGESNSDTHQPNWPLGSNTQNESAPRNIPADSQLGSTVIGSRRDTSATQLHGPLRRMPSTEGVDIPRPQVQSVHGSVPSREISTGLEFHEQVTHRMVDVQRLGAQTSSLRDEPARHSNLQSRTGGQYTNPRTTSTDDVRIEDLNSATRIPDSSAATRARLDFTSREAGSQLSSPIRRDAAGLASNTPNQNRIAKPQPRRRRRNIGGSSGNTRN